MVGSRLRQYVVAEKLGEGGMGVVWKARDTVLGRDVALKVLPADSARDEVRRERFFREARAASALNHPNIVTVYEINSEEGVAFIAMELVEGDTLSARLAAGPLPVVESLAIARQIAEAVARAHRAGIVHRDLKPGNVMINADGLVKVLDFGLAKVPEPARTGDRTSEETRQALTRAGTAMGTMGYMSPEQALGDPADARSDVFSFGVILYEMLAGALPFQGHTNTELLRALHFAEPEPLERVRPEVASWVASIVARALAKDPKDRFSSMGEVAAALRGSMVVPSAPVPTTRPAAPRGPAEPAPRVPAARRYPPAWSVAAVVSTVVFSAWALIPWDRAARTGESEPPPVADTSPAGRTREATGLLLRYDRRGNVGRAIELLEQAIGADPQHAAAHAQLALAFRLQNQASPDKLWLQRGRASADRALALNPDLAIAHVASGFLHLDAARLDDARQAFDRAIELEPANPLARMGTAQALAAAKRTDDAARAFTEAVQSGRSDWRTHLARGLFEFRRTRYAEAIAALEAAAALTPDNAVVMRNLGAAYYMGGRPDDAASALQRALETVPTGPVYTNLATIRFSQGRYADAAAAFEQAVKLDANNFLVWGNLGDAYRWAPGRRAESSEPYRRALQLVAAEIAATPDDLDLQTLRASYLAKAGDPEASRVIARLERDARLTGQMLVRVATVHEIAGDRTRALEAIARALEAGFPVRELAADPELTALRADVRYHRMVAAAPDQPQGPP